MRRPKGTLLRCGVAAGLLVAACAPAESDATPIDVLMEDFQLTLGADEMAAGAISFHVSNEDGEVHEIEVFAGAEPGRLPEVVDSIADVTDLTLIDEVEDIIPGSSASLVVDLEPGTYLVMCNLPNHFELGMWAFLEVTG
jgi:uncharacterized cupredoxin-like copper-binding protein